jgi:hypothetical protein
VPPVTTFSTSPGSGWWEKVPVTVTLRATDASSGVAYTKYKVGSVESTYTGPFTISAEGTSTVEFWSVDGSPQANKETPRIDVVRIDTSAPTISTNAVGVYNGSAKITITARDPYSGPSFLQVRVDAEETQTVPALSPLSVSAVLSVAKPGRHTISYYAEDLLRHSSSGAVSFTVKPAQSIAKSPSAGTQVLVRRAGSVTWRFGATLTSSSRPLAGKTVYLQKLTNGVWRTATGALKTNAYGKVSYSRVYRSASAAAWRWYSPGTATLAPAYSTKTLVIVR